MISRTLIGQSLLMKLSDWSTLRPDPRRQQGLCPEILGMSSLLTSESDEGMCEVGIYWVSRTRDSLSLSGYLPNCHGSWPGQPGALLTQCGTFREEGQWGDRQPSGPHQALDRQWGARQPSGPHQSLVRQWGARQPSGPHQALVRLCGRQTDLGFNLKQPVDLNFSGR